MLGDFVYFFYVLITSDSTQSHFYIILLEF